MAAEPLAERDFRNEDQVRFALLSGDCNPMHMDPLAARRTMAGAPVVHGIHVLLWSLDCLFRSYDGLTVASLKVTFDKMIYVGDHVALTVSHSAHSGIALTCLVDATKVMTARLKTGEPAAGQEVLSHALLAKTAEPVVLDFARMADRNGIIPWDASLSQGVAALFPAAVDALGIGRVAALACSSYLVGMECPGLHSIFGGLQVSTTADGAEDGSVLQFRVAMADPRFRLIKMAISGGGWTGSVDAYARPEPARQPAMPILAAKIAGSEFRGGSVLVVGGSRGLGELIAKMAAVGGAHVTLTYAVGEADARRVQAELRAHGLSCDVMRYDVRDSPEQQLASLSTAPNEVYYMATPLIFRRRTALFEAKRLQEFLTFYVTGFYQLCKALKRMSPDRLSIFYPSSEFVDKRPAGMTEYTMAKTAGEVLCADMLSFERPGSILVQRLPRLATDQTATIMEVDEADAVEVLLPIMRKVHADRLRR